MFSSIPLMTMVTATTAMDGGTSACDGAAGPRHSAPAVQGYDVVSYQTGGGPLRGTGHHVSTHQGLTYLFANEENKQAFDRAPERFVPAYGGFCAYGVAVGKKLVGDPDVWKVVEGRLYLNLDAGIQATWSQDVPGNIAKADRSWSSVCDRHLDSL